MEGTLIDRLHASPLNCFSLYIKFILTSMRLVLMQYLPIGEKRILFVLWEFCPESFRV